MRLLGGIALFCVGCSGATPAFVVDVKNGGKVAPAAVTVSMFDAYGLMGRSRIAHPKLPGRLVIDGLPGVAEAVRVVAAAEDPLMLAGVRFDFFPQTAVAQTLILRSDALDSDGDGVPDPVDDCPTVPDPDQANHDGQGGGDACADGDLGPQLPDASVDDLATAGSGTPGADLSGQLGHDMLYSTPPPPDLGKPVDLAKPSGPDLLTPPSDDMANIPIFTEGFENGVTATNWPVQTQTNGYYNETPNFVHRGNSSLHVALNAISSGGSGTVQLAETVAVPLPDLYVRVFVYVPAGADTASVAVLSVNQSGAPHKGLSLDFAQNSFATVDSVPANPLTTTASTPTLPTNQWVCLEWHLHVAASGFAKAYVNGTEVGALTVVQPLLPSPTFSEVAIGLAGTTPAAARDVYFDDFAVDRYPIGCTK